MKVHVKGKGQVDLTSNDFIAEGGQGKVYAKGNTVYKVYHDPKKMIPFAKIQELAVLKEPNILKPEDLLLNGKNAVIGYTMHYVPDTHPLCKLFTKAFRQREGITDDQIFKLVTNMQETIRHIHACKLLVVDLNEMNFLVSNKFDSVLFIDVDSYQTPSFPATVLMESVRDRHMKPGQFTTGTDWFSFAVVSFQMFIGIHPYKGKHPKYTGTDALNERMKANVSVLNPKVGIPAICQPFNVIPKPYLDWYDRVLEQGDRIAPPSYSGVQVVVPVVVVHKQVGSNIFDIEEVATVTGDIISYYTSGTHDIIVTEDSVYLNGRQDVLDVKNPVFGFTPKMNHPLATYYHGGLIHVHDVIGQKELFNCAGKATMAYDNRLYIQNDTHILEVEIYETAKTIISVRQVCNILEKSTQMFEGVVIQNLLGSHYASIFPVTGQSIQVSMKDLNGYKILDAKFDKGILMVIASKAGKYDRFVFRFDNSWTCDIRKVEDVAYSALNFTVLDNGICVCINEEEQVEVFSNTKDRADIKVIDDPAVDSNMKLFHKGTRVLFAKGGKLSSMKMRKK